MLDRLTSLLGLATFIGLAWVISLNRRQFPVRTVVGGLVLQFALAFIILKTAFGKILFTKANDAFTSLLGYADEGSMFVFGFLAKREVLENAVGRENSFVFFASVMGTIILVAALSSLLYHYGILQQIVRGIAWVMQRLMATSGSESLAAAANIFMGQTEAPLVIKPYLKHVTRSELLALMVPGMASIAGGVLAAYVKFGVSAGHLVTASFMSAPAALLISKIILPETEKSETSAGAHAELEKVSKNGIDAICIGASEGMSLSLNVMAMLIAFVAIVAMANGILTGAQSLFGVAVPIRLEEILGVLNAPFAWLIGIPWHDCQNVGSILGTRIVLNEFLAYRDLAAMGNAIEPRSFTLATYALCGFANFASIAIQIGGIGALAPERRHELAALGLRAMIGGLLACYMTACIVGLLT